MKFKTRSPRLQAALTTNCYCPALVAVFTYEDNLIMMMQTCVTLLPKDRNKEILNLQLFFQA